MCVSTIISLFFKKKKRLYRDTHVEGGDVKIEAEIGVVLLQDKIHQRFLVDKCRKTQGKIPPYRFQRERGPVDTLILDFWLLN